MIFGHNVIHDGIFYPCGENVPCEPLEAKEEKKIEAEEPAKAEKKPAKKK